MELPAALRSAVDAELDGVPLAELRAASALLSQRYRAELRDGRLHMASSLAVKAYLATRLPATYAAVRAAMEEAQAALPGLAPRTQLDVGSGPGTAAWAAAATWRSLQTVELVEASRAAAETGVRLARSLPLKVRWHVADGAGALAAAQAADLVSLCYVLDELAPSDVTPLLDRLWAKTAGVLVVVEPGTPAGWRRILGARERLTGHGAFIAAPCTHAGACALSVPDWCHFARRVARSRIHRLAKDADVPWEDEKFVYLAASRMPARPIEARVLAPPRHAKGRIDLKLCRADGAVVLTTVTRRDADAYRIARRLDWGDAVCPDADGHDHESS